eukprot:TRINITY_DN2472_c0_g1_i1.p2 TRINITY_DN2472_c0_g1~~TRINITY_DN2472_c0_g1_i1.p2  ORF type:complete len:243 (+),score=46.45 TRINITY_DN2472_c0_g1_i1:79-807(+)
MSNMSLITPSPKVFCKTPRCAAAGKKAVKGRDTCSQCHQSQKRHQASEVNQFEIAAKRQIDDAIEAANVSTAMKNHFEQAAEKVQRVRDKAEPIVAANMLAIGQAFTTVYSPSPTKRLSSSQYAYDAADEFLALDTSRLALGPSSPSDEAARLREQLEEERARTAEEIAELKAENADLRKQLAHMVDVVADRDTKLLEMADALKIKEAEITMLRTAPAKSAQPEQPASTGAKKAPAAANKNR